MWGFELGNEVNNVNSPAQNCSISPLQQADAFQTFIAALKILYPDVSTRPKIVGPDSGGTIWHFDLSRHG